MMMMMMMMMTKNDIISFLPHMISPMPTYIQMPRQKENQ
jgi:hypothetical protein